MNYADAMGMKLKLTLALAFVCASAVASETTLVVGKLISNEPMEYVPDECPENAICMRSWWRSVIEVDETIQGPSLTGRVEAAVMQHTGLNERYKKSVRLFVLRPIEDPKERARLRVDYYLDGMSEPHQVFCLAQKPADIGLEVDRTFVSGEGDNSTYCFELPTTGDSR